MKLGVISQNFMQFEFAEGRIKPAQQRACRDYLTYIE
tara:strand:+ start:356 stop:466 length:111 start_codon:yes stop_codon:yes gene_type:complete